MGSNCSETENYPTNAGTYQRISSLPLYHQTLHKKNDTNPTKNFVEVRMLCYMRIINFGCLYLLFHHHSRDIVHVVILLGDQTHS